MATTPYLFGDNRAVKYSVLPTSKYTSKETEFMGESYLSDAMEVHLKRNVATFDFCVQIRKDDMPIEDAAQEWDENASPFIKVASLHIPTQNFRTQERADMAEAMSFSPDHALAEHAPIGGLNRARSAIYKALSKFRHKRDGRADMV